MQVKNENGVVTITMTEKDAKVFAIPLLVLVDRQDEMDANDLGTTDEALEHGIKIAEAINNRFKEMGYHEYEPRSEDDGEEDED